MSTAVLLNTAAQMIICMKLINNSIFSLKWNPFFDGFIYGHLQHQVILFPTNFSFNSPFICHSPDPQPFLHAVRMHPDLIIYTERDQQTSQLLLSWAALELLSESSCKSMEGTESGKNYPNNYELTSTAMASDQSCHWGTRPKAYNNYSVVIKIRY